MLSDRQIEALAQGCAKCGKPFAEANFCLSAYLVDDLSGFEDQLELGITAVHTRTLWVHVDCQNVKLEGWDMLPDIHICIRCKKPLDKKHLVQPVFQVTDGKAVNPNDPTDFGVAIGDRIYFMHGDCANPRLDGSQGNILLA